MPYTIIPTYLLKFPQISSGLWLTQTRLLHCFSTGQMIHLSNLYQIIFECYKDLALKNIDISGKFKRLILILPSAINIISFSNLFYSEMIRRHDSASFERQ